MTERELKEIREKISCPQLGDNHYGEWGILTKKQRLTIKKMLDHIESQEQYIKKWQITVLWWLFGVRIVNTHI